MRTELFRFDLLARRRSLVFYAIGMALYAFVIVALYPQFKNDSGLNSITKHAATIASLIGITGSLTSSSGWLSANIYANFFPLILLLATIGYGAACIAGQDELGTLALVATLPIPRSRVVGQKVLALIAQATAIVVVVAAVVLVGRLFDIAVSPGYLVEVSLAVLLLGIDFGLVAFAVGAATGNRGLAVGVAAGVAAASYLVSSLAPVVNWVRPARIASLFYWSVGNSQLTGGVSVAGFAVMILVGVALIILSVWSFKRLDLH
jgi:ABC-2 type transport system permease protein